jgi:uncharacterized protein (TIGR03437 family)
MRFLCRKALAVLLFAAVGRLVYGSDAAAVAISAGIQARHAPYGAVLDPTYASPTSNQIVGYTRCGDSALWTGAYLAAEAFRYNVTQDPAALSNAKQAIAALTGLADVTGTNLLARCMVPVTSPYAKGIESEEAPNGIHVTTDWVWVGNTSRDEFVGAIFGLANAYDLINDAGVKSSTSALITRLIAFLTGNNWSVNMPDGSSSTTFLVRPDELLGLLQVGRHVNPSKFSTYYDEQRILLSTTVSVPAGVDSVDNSSYFKFSLDYMNFYNLIRMESSSAQSLYRTGYDLVRGHTAGHQNAFFDIVDRALSGPDAVRDAETRMLLAQWQLRPSRDQYVDDTKLVTVCGSVACQPVPVPLRPPTDFLWQRDPFQLTGGGIGTIESAGIDYILPYWMGRYYSTVTSVTVQSAAAATSAVAPGSAAAIYGPGLASATASAGSLPLPTTLGGVTVTVTDNAGKSYPASLYYVSPQQINLLVPEGVALGVATFSIVNGTSTQIATALVQAVAPALFSADGTGTGVAAATGIRTQAGNPNLQSPITVFTCGSSGCTGVPLNVGVDTPVFLSFYGTGIHHLSSLANVTVTINGISVPVLYAGAQGTYPGLDQVNVPLTLNLRGAGVANVVLTVDGQTANTVTITVQ